MRQLPRIGFLTSAGAGIFAIAVGAWLTQLVLAPRLPYRADCQMAWSAMSEPDIILFGSAGLIGVVAGSAYWPRRGTLLRTAVRPGVSVMTMIAGLLAMIVVASVPSIVVLESSIRAQGGSACVSASAFHLLGTVVFGLGVGMAAAHWLNPLLAAVTTLAALAILYAIFPSVTDKKLLNVGVTPLPMMDMRRSWTYAASMVVILIMITAALLATVVASKRARIALAVAAALSFSLAFTPATSDFIEIHPDARVCAAVYRGKEVCVPKSYHWLSPGVVESTSRMLRAAEGDGVDLGSLPSRFELGQFERTSSRSTAQMSLSSGFISDGRVPALETAGLLVTPSWCASMRSEEPPDGLLRQSGVMAVWFAMTAGFVSPRDAGGFLPADVVDPATLSADDITTGLRAAQACEVAQWAS